MTSTHAASKNLLIGFLASFALAACGGGGGTSSPVPTADATSPTVTGVTPVNNAANVAVSTTVSVNFSEPMDCTTITTSSLTVSSGSAVGGNVTCSGNSATFTPSNLTAGTAYTVSIGTAAKDIAGNPLASAFSSGFTTAAASSPAIYTIGGTVSGLSGSVVLRNNGSDTLTISANGGFTFVTTLAAGAAYNVVVLSQPTGQICAVSNGSGTVGSADITNVAVACKSWSTPMLIENSDAGRGIVIDASGNVTVVRVTSNSSPSPGSASIWADRYSAGSWSTPVLIRSGLYGSGVGTPRIAADPSGNVVAVWHQYDGTRNSIFASRYSAGSWGTAEPIEMDDVSGANFPQIAVDVSGNAIAVWEQWVDNQTRNIWANRYVVGSGWGTAALIETSPGLAEMPQISIDAGGNAIAVWRQFDGARTNVWANRYIVGSGWGTAVLIENSLADATHPQVAFDASGNAMAVWAQASNFFDSIWAARYTTAGGWGAPTLIESNDTGSAYFPQVVVDTNGNAIAAWEHLYGARTHVMSNRYTIGSGWGAAQAIDTAGITSDVSHSSEPKIGIDATGNVIAVWGQYQGTTPGSYTRTYIRANRYTVGSGWGAATQIENGTSTQDAFDHQLSVNASGRAIAVWLQWNSVNLETWANFYQ